MEKLISGECKVPKDFESGVDFNGKELEMQWSVMASLIEFESLLSAGKRFLDRSWCCLADRLGGEVADIRTLGGSIYNLKKILRDKRKRNYINKLPYFSILKLSWDEWGSELADIRNYVEHTAPMGGRSLGYIINKPDGKGYEIKSLLPDKIPSGKADLPKEKLTFNEQKLSIDYARTTVEKLDNLLSKLLSYADALVSPTEQSRKAIQL
jgi:hypothetical protein